MTLKEESKIAAGVYAFLAVVVIGLFIYTAPDDIKAQGVSQTCNNSGVLLRADGTTVIDAWKDYSGNRSAVPSSLPTSPGFVPSFTTVDLPLAITLGKSLAGNVRVCLEDSNGSRCVPLDTLRKVK